MILLDERYQIKHVCKMFPVWALSKNWASAIWTEEQKQEKSKQIQMLDPETCTAEDIAKIVGHDFYVQPHHCHECDQVSWECVQLGQEPDYESATAIICKDCLRKALTL